MPDWIESAGLHKGEDSVDSREEPRVLAQIYFDSSIGVHLSDQPRSILWLSGVRRQQLWRDVLL